MFSRFRYALVRQPTGNIGQGLTTQTLGKPSYEQTREQYAAYLTALRRCNLQVTRLAPLINYPDAHYIEDTAVIYAGTAFITRLADEHRANETIYTRSSIIARTPLNKVELNNPDAHLEGGDVLFCSGGRVLIGIGERSNLAGATELAAGLRALKPDLKIEIIPFSGVIHLKTGLTEIAPNILIHNPQMKMEQPINFAEIIDLPPDEGYAANVLPINNRLLIAAGYPATYEIAKRYYPEGDILSLDMSEFQKMDGGLTCLSLRYN